MANYLFSESEFVIDDSKPRDITVGDLKCNTATITTLNGITSGVWVPVPANLVGASAVEAYQGTWSQIGNIVTIASKFNITCSPTASTIQFTFTLPVAPASNFSANTQLCGALSYRLSNVATPGIAMNIQSTVGAKTGQIDIVVSAVQANPVVGYIASYSI